MEEESGQLHPLSDTREAEDGLQDTTEERVDRGFSEESLGGPFGLLTCVLAPLQLAGFLS